MKDVIEEILLYKQDFERVGIEHLKKNSILSSSLSHTKALCTKILRSMIKKKKSYWLKTTKVIMDIKSQKSW